MASVVRGWLTSIHVERVKKEKNHAATIIQACRPVTSLSQCYYNYVSTIGVRRWLAKVRFTALLVRRTKSAIQIQSGEW